MVERIKVSKHFHLDEFVDPFTYFTENDRGISKIDNRLFKIADLMREKLGKPLRINNWWAFYAANSEKSNEWLIKKIEASYYSKWSGFRSIKCRIGAKLSAHKLGRAIDPKGDEEAMFKIVKDNIKEFYNLGLRRLEDPSITKGWLHMDIHTLNVQPNTIRVVDLKKCTQTLKVA
jgi:hypothetical protein